MEAKMPKRPSLYRTKSCGSSRVTYLDQAQAIEQLRVQAARLVESHPEVLEVRLFGSLARGRAVPGSDADVLVVLRGHPLPRWFDRIPEFAAALQETGLPIEVFPYTLAELEQMEGRGVAAEARRGLFLARQGQRSAGE
jgi:predicted nucleotidyltransferase